MIYSAIFFNILKNKKVSTPSPLPKKKSNTTPPRPASPPDKALSPGPTKYFIWPLAREVRANQKPAMTTKPLELAFTPGVYTREHNQSPTSIEVCVAISFHSTAINCHKRRFGNAIFHASVSTPNSGPRFTAVDAVTTHFLSRKTLKLKWTVLINNFVSCVVISFHSTAIKCHKRRFGTAIFHASVSKYWSKIHSRRRCNRSFLSRKILKLKWTVLITFTHLLYNCM